MRENVVKVENRYYFCEPTQVAFWDCGMYKYVSGIAFKDNIICCDRGGLYKISEVVDPVLTPDGYDPIVVYDHWVNLDSKILDEREERRNGTN